MSEAVHLQVHVKWISWKRSILSLISESETHILYILNKIINATLLFLPPFFMSWTQRSKIYFMCTEGLFLKYWGGGVRKPVCIWCTHHLQHRVDQVVDCGLWNVGPLLFWLCEVAGYWQELEHAGVYADPEHPKHAQWVTYPASRLVMQELGCFQLPGIVYRSLQHGAVGPGRHAATWWWSWMNGTTMGLRILSQYLCAFKMPSIKCTCVHCP